MAIRSRDEIIVDINTNVLRSEEQADIFPGQVLRDVSVNAVATEMENLYNEAERISIAQAISNANLMTVEELNNLASNFGIVRKTATQSIGTVTFFTASLPTEVVSIPRGTSLGTNLTEGNTEVTFSTRFDIFFDPALEGSFFNANTGTWEISVDVVADVPGSIGNVGPFTIDKIRNSNIPFNVRNDNAATGGGDQESNNDFGIRILNSLLGSNVGTKNGYQGTALGQDDILDTLVIGPGDDLMLRDGGLGGKVDIWSISNPGSITQLSPESEPSLFIEDWNTGAQRNLGFRFNFPQKPVDATSPIILTASTGPSGTISNVLLYEKRTPAPDSVEYVNPSGSHFHYEVFISDDLETGHSARSNDHIIWNPDEMDYLRTFDPDGTVFSGNTMDVSITYSYDKAVSDLQDVLNGDNNKIITADVLSKQAQKIQLDVTMNVVLLPSFKETQTTENETIANVEDAIISEINNTTLGSKVEASDLVQAAHNVDGVDNVILDSINIIRKRPVFFDVEAEQITDDATNENEYFEADVITVTSIT